MYTAIFPNGVDLVLELHAVGLGQAPAATLATNAAAEATLRICACIEARTHTWQRGTRYVLSRETRRTLLRTFDASAVRARACANGSPPTAEGAMRIRQAKLHNMKINAATGEVGRWARFALPLAPSGFDHFGE